MISLDKFMDFRNIENSMSAPNNAELLYSVYIIQDKNGEYEKITALQGNGFLDFVRRNEHHIDIVLMLQNINGTQADFLKGCLDGYENSGVDYIQRIVDRLNSGEKFNAKMLTKEIWDYLKGYSERKDNQQNP